VNPTIRTHFWFQWTSIPILLAVTIQLSWTLHAVTDIMSEIRKLSAEWQATACMTTGGEMKKLLFSRADSGPLQSPVQLEHAVKRPECHLNLVPRLKMGNTRQRSWLRHYAVNWKVGVSIPDEVISLFNWPNPYCRSRVLGSIQPLTEMSTRNVPGG
jgi:hypothetical protein